MVLLLKEKLVIQNFGPIKSVELELGRFNVLIGENATGKSTVAKVLSVCRYFTYLLNSEHFIEHPFENGLEAWGMKECIKDGSYIFYKCKDYSFTAKYNVEPEYDSEGEVDSVYEKFNVFLNPISTDFKKLLEELEKIRPKSQSIYDFSYLNWNIPASFLENDVKRIMNNPFYLPTERGLQSVFSLGKSSIGNLADSLFNQFANLDQIARLFKQETLIEPLSITYKNDNGHGFVKKDGEEQYFSLYNAASGYQSTIPVVLLMKYYGEIRKRRKTFIIEEPELNLFPTVQNKLMQYLVDKAINFDNQILITTHSPYTLTSLNNMMYAYELGLKNEHAVAEIIEKKYWLNPSEVSAYRMLEDGTCKDIMDRDESGTLIKADEIDGVSRELNKIFDDLIAIEHNEGIKEL